MITDWKTQKKIILNRLRAIFIYEFDKDLLYTKLKKAGFDVNTRLNNVEYLFAGYLDNIFKLIERDIEGYKDCKARPDKIFKDIDDER